jgi:hypothetical protein
MAAACPLPENRSTRELSKARRKRIIRGFIAIAIFAAMFLIFLLLLNFLTADKGAQKEFGTASEVRHAITG